MANIHLSDVDHVVYSFDPHLLLGEEKGNGTIEIPLETGMETGPSKWTSPWDPLFLCSIVRAKNHLVDGYPHHLQKRFKGAKAVHFKWHFVEHHIAHAASAYYPSPFNNAAVLTLDCRVEIATTSYNIGSGNELIRIGQVAVFIVERQFN